ncbi:VacJ [Subsaximicrobium wynnwilliamsii]|uniref:VacJ n=1 Tax=Subsaximicrobium wynnwilliamsii TaxID=291179 RepID=A0A5C6ZDH6_9FLAO|nr:VacJ [Subsaximicrobium wynnwilliamsii]TXD81410.1 VacJ [Subsaximicrobium wynnwilliamsii]TXD87126.1 VacJ [Subsaximicrobium wynnwilliamsii]TXE00680.1 VacJ [Subsaximicrobium wynnwilliamsii]
MILLPTINRSVLLVIPKQPFYDWSNKLFPDLEPTNMADIDEYNSYLLEDELFIDDPKGELKSYWKKIFLNELYEQCMDETTFPALSWKLFTQWFDFHRSAVVSDLTSDPLYTDE